MSPKKTNYQKYKKCEISKKYQKWLKPLSSNSEKAYCTICHTVIDGQLLDIPKHESSESHINAIKLHDSFKIHLQFENKPLKGIKASQYIPNEMVGSEFFITEKDDDSTKELTHSKWSLDGVKTLLSHITHYWKDFQDCLRKKKDIWEDIAKLMEEGGYEFSSHECAKKFRNIKLRYFTILERRLLGYKQNTRIDYFNELNALLANEPETLAYLECKKLNAQPPNAVGLDSEEDSVLANSEFDIVNDGDMEWNEVSTLLLLDLLLEFRDWFSSKEDEDEDTIWGIIADQMKKEGYSIDKDICRRKWHNLSQLFDHYSLIVESTGTLPLWPYYTRVRHVLNTVDIAIRGLKEKKEIYGKSMNLLKVSRTSKIEEMKGTFEKDLDISMLEHLHEQGTSINKTGKQLELAHSSNFSSEDSNALYFLRKMRENATIWQRLNSVESYLSELSDNQELQRHTNLLLTQILAEISTLATHFCPKIKHKQRQFRNRITIPGHQAK